LDNILCGADVTEADRDAVISNPTALTGVQTPDINALSLAQQRFEIGMHS
jgi:hypothetical protein